MADSVLKCLKSDERNQVESGMKMRETAGGASRYGKKRKSRSGAGPQNPLVSGHGMHRYHSIGLA